jgi:hypothetical protein
MAGKKSDNKKTNLSPTLSSASSFSSPTAKHTYINRSKWSFLYKALILFKKENLVVNFFQAALSLKFAFFSRFIFKTILYR